MVAAPFIVLILYLLYLEYKKEKCEAEPVLTPIDLGFLLLVSFLWTFLSGNGGYSFQVSDFFGHNSKFYDLYTSGWPYYFSDVNRLVRYYFGYYLVPAYIFKLIGYISPPVLFIWTNIGFALGLSWIYIMVFRNKILLILFLLLGGCGTILFKISNRFIDFPPQLNTFHSNFGSLFDQSRWVANHVIPCIIVSCIVIYDTVIQKKDKSFFPVSLTLVWAIFPFLILSMIYAFNRSFYERKIKLFRKDFFFDCILPVIALIPALCYFGAGGNPPTSGFIWQFLDDKTYVYRYFTGIFLDTAVFYYIFIKLFKPTDAFSKIHISILFLMFLCLSTVILGKWNDWLTKMNISFMIIFLIVTLRAGYLRWIDHEFKHFSKTFAIVVTIVLCLNLLTQSLILVQPITENVLSSQILKTKFTPMPYKKYANFYKTLIEYASEEEAIQYMATPNSFYERNLAKTKN